MLFRFWVFPDCTFLDISMAISACATLGFTVSAFEIIPLLFYPMLLCLSSLLFILFDRK